MTYGKNVSISRASAYQRNRNVVTMSAQKSGLGPVSNIIVLILVMCLLGLMYLTQVTKTNSLGYKVSNLSAKQEELKEEYASLEVEATRLQSLERVKNSSVAQKLPDAKPTAIVAN
jgi:cell division protein FtsL